MAVHSMVKQLTIPILLLPFATAQNPSSSVLATSTLITTGANAQFTIPADVDNGANLLPTVYDTAAVQAQDVCPGYKADNVQETQGGFTASLALAGAACNAYGTDVEHLTLTVAVQDNNRLNIRIVPTYIGSSNTSWFILPEESAPLPKQSNPNGKIDLKIDWTNDPTFGFSVTRRSTNDVIFDTRGRKLVYEDQYIEFVSALPEDYNLYGLGENIHNLRLGNNYTVTMFAADSGNPIDANIYGSHPVYIDTRYYEVDRKKCNLIKSSHASASSKYISRSHGLFNRNAHPQEILLRNDSITWRALGGAIDLYFLDGPSAQDVISQYQTGITGLPALQQYWTFGFHQSRWGYKNWTELEDVVNTYRKFDIPLETIWTDIDYMFQYRDFTNDPNTFPYEAGREFLNRLHAQGQHYVPIVDSAIYIPNPNNASDNYTFYDDGHDRNVFMRNPDGSEYVGAVWPGYTVFPDWHAPQAVQWWADSLLEHYRNVPWDGIWIDMSEVSSFCIGSCGSENYTKYGFAHTPFALPGEPGNVDYRYPEGFNLTNATEAATISSLAAAQSSSIQATAGPTPTTTQTYFTPTVTPGSRNVNYPPYTINNVLGELAVHAMSPNATHIDGILDYDVHNLFGHQILNATYQGLLQVFPGKRPFIIGRSTFAGSGVWAGHWGGDNISLFAYMYFSISQALSFAVYGFPMFGPDACGFTSNSDEELCNRWMQLSAFFPFYRNHNVLAAIPQEAYVWESVAKASKIAMEIRYSLLPYMYTLFHKAHTSGSTVMRALAWEFPDDPTLAAIDNQFLLGSSLLITPVLGQGLTSRGGVFPGVARGEIWYDWYNQSAINAQPGVNHTIDAPLGHIPVYVRGGAILPQQEALYTTRECRNSSWSLIVALNKRGNAQGEIYIDDGESLEQVKTKQVKLKAYRNKIVASSKGGYVDSNRLANITILGVDKAPTAVKLNDQTISNGIDYNSASKVVSIKGLESLTPNGAWAQDWQLSWS